MRPSTAGEESAFRNGSDECEDATQMPFRFFSQSPEERFKRMTIEEPRISSPDSLRH